MPTGARTLTVTFAGDTDQLTKASKTAVKDLDKVEKSSRDVGETFGDNASKSAQLAGGFGDLGGALSNMGGPLGSVGSTMEVMGPAIMGVTGAMDLAELATGAWTGVQWLLNAALDAMPIILIVAGIIALIAVIVLAWQHSETFRDIVTGAFDAVLDVIMGVWHWVQDNWPLLLAIITGPIGIATLLIIDNWQKIKDGFSAVYNWIVSVAGNIFTFITGIPGKISGALSGMWDFIWHEFRDALNKVIGWWNDLHFPSFTIPVVHVPLLGDIGGGTIGVCELPNITKFAAGGVVTRATLGIFGEAGPEAIIPLDRAGFGTTVNLYVDVPPTANPAETGRAVASALRSYFAAGGRLAVPASAPPCPFWASCWMFVWEWAGWRAPRSGTPGGGI